MGQLITCGQAYLGVTGADRIVRTTGVNAVVEDSFAPTSVDPLGVTLYGNNVYYSAGTAIYKNSGFSGTQLDSVAAPVTGVTISGITFNQSGQMILGGGTKVYRFSGFNGTVVDDITPAQYEGTSLTVRGVSYDAGNVYWSDGNTSPTVIGTMRKGSGFSSTELARTEYTSNINHDCSISHSGGQAYCLHGTSTLFVLNAVGETTPTSTILLSAYDAITTGLEYISTEERLGILVPEDLSTGSRVGVSWPLGVVSDIYGAPAIDTTYLEANLSIAGITSHPSLDTAHFVMVLDIADLTASSVLDSPSPVLVVSDMQVNSILDRPIPVVVVSDLIGRPSIDVPVPFLVIKDMSVISNMDTVTLLTPASTLCNISFACSTPSVSFEVLS